ncbi:hypothetical protein LSH36_154g09036 [Paralvinella palmiformis]|uniref:Uncharacterized protein n=1 Tax=Paralvinella palmiformis TaxID=53620 RepID=A0AAD9JV59_9ANNE|nr:hypothetical protein LSH36_154g09036 [Paralvinella palmiformis]
MISLRIIALRRVSVFSRNEHLFSPCCRSRTRVFPNWRGTFLQPSRANSNSSNRGSSEGMNRILSRVVLFFGRSHNHLASDHRVEQGELKIKINPSIMI